MAADQNDGVRPLVRGRIADFVRTNAAAVAILAFVLGISVGQIIAGFAERERIAELKMRIDRLEMQKFDALKK